MERRHFLTVSAASIGGLLIYSLEGRLLRISADENAIRIPLRFFTEEEARIVEAVTERIFPSDEAGPGAKQAGVVIYIDRQLAGPYGQDRYRYTKPPFLAGVPDMGYQGEATPAQIYRQELKRLGGFDQLGVTEQDKKLKEMEQTYFFTLLKRHTVEGLFCDPMHGGNVDMIGWQMIGFPGPRMSNRDDIGRSFGEAFRPKPTSLDQILADKVAVSEDVK